jgi:hypothetical protein
VHKFCIDIALYPGKLLSETMHLMGEDLLDGHVESVVEPNPQFLGRLLGRDRNLEPLERHLQLRSG